MGRFRKGKKQKSQDLWQLAGGRDALLKAFMKHKLSDSATAEKWMAVTLDVFKKSDPKCIKWMKVIWTENRKGLRTGVLGDSFDQQLPVCEEEVPPEESHGLLQGEPELSQIKEEWEESWTSQEGEERQVSEEAGIVMFLFSHASVKREQDTESPQSLQLCRTQDPELLQMKEEQLFNHLEEGDGSKWTLHPAKHAESENARSSHLTPTDPELHQVKDEPFRGLEATDGKVTEVLVNCEDGQKNVLSFQCLHNQWGVSREAEPPPRASTEQMDSEPDWEDCTVPEPDSNFSDSTRDGQLLSSDFSGTETDDSDDWAETQSCFKTLKVQTGVKPYSCSFCGKRFKGKNSLKMHVRTHTGEKPFVCSICGKSFGVGFTLKLHMRTHSNEKPFTCSVCGKGFSQNGNLKEHFRTHSDEKPFSCAVCGQPFRQSSTLKRHLRTHTNEKPFSCPICQKCFSQSGNLRTHMRTHDKSFRCIRGGKADVHERSTRTHANAC